MNKIKKTVFRDTHLGNKRLKKYKKVITTGINVMVTFVGLGRAL